MKRLIYSAVFFSVVMITPVHAADIEAKYAQSCATCHATGVLGAPKTGDTTAWQPRLKQGSETLLSRVVNGYKNMPAKGLCSDCSDEDYIALIKFMSQ
jgi:cytochrome c5